MRRAAALLAALALAACATDTTWEPLATLQTSRRPVALSIAWDAMLSDVALRGVQVRVDDQLVHVERGDLAATVARGSWTGRVAHGVHHVAIVYDVGPRTLTPWGYDRLYAVRSVRDVHVADRAVRVDLLLVEDPSLTTPIDARLRVDQRETEP